MKLKIISQEQEIKTELLGLLLTMTCFYDLDIYKSSHKFLVVVYYFSITSTDPIICDSSNDLIPGIKVDIFTSIN